MELRKKNTPKPLEYDINRANERSMKTLRASYAVAKVGKSHTIAERLAKPAVLVCAKELLGENAAYALQKIFLFNDTVRRRQNKMAENLEEQLMEYEAPFVMLITHVLGQHL